MSTALSRPEISISVGVLGAVLLVLLASRLSPRREMLVFSVGLGITAVAYLLFALRVCGAGLLSWPSGGLPMWPGTFSSIMRVGRSSHLLGTHSSVWDSTSRWAGTSPVGSQLCAGQHHDQGRSAATANTSHISRSRRHLPMENGSMPPLPNLLASAPALLAGLLSVACECVDCNRAVPMVGYVRALVQEEGAGAVNGASVHLENRLYVTEPQMTSNNGLAVLLVYLGQEPTDTGTITVQPPAGYDTPSPQQVVIPAGDTVSIEFSLRRL
jgi:hypothetical protein